MALQYLAAPEAERKVGRMFVVVADQSMLPGPDVEDTGHCVCSTTTYMFDVT